MKKPICQTTLKRIITACPAELPRTDALQKRIKIGVGYHNKWYRSQKEHWLGWIVFQEHKAREIKRDIAAITARQRWSGLNCIPMMFWLAEAVELDNSLLDQAYGVAVEEAKVITHDCPRHGKAMRGVLAWENIEEGLAIAQQAEVLEAQEAGNSAFAYLALKLCEYRKYLDNKDE